MSDTSSPVEIDYTSRDYTSVLSFLVSTARGRLPEWISAGEPADFGTALLEMWAYCSDVMNYYVDRAASEPFLATAVRRASVLAIAQMLGYVPIAQQAARGVVTFTLDTGYNPGPDVGALTIPADTVVQTPGTSTTEAISFELIDAAYLSDTTRTATAGAVEGRTIHGELLTISDGSPMQEYVLHYPGVIHRSVRLSVQETDQIITASTIASQNNPMTFAWTYVDNLVDTDPDASVYTTFIDDRGFTHVVFGDNVSGRIPPVGAAVTVDYRYGKGAMGNVAIGAISLITPPIPSVNVTNLTIFNGGADNESIDSMRHGIPKSVKIKSRAVTLQDFADLAQQVPGVAKSVATGLFYTQVKVYIAPVGADYPQVWLIDQVQGYLQDRSMVGTVVEMHPMKISDGQGGWTVDRTDYIYVNVVVTIVVHVLPQFGQLTVTNAVTAAVNAVFDFDNPAINFGCLVSRGEVYHAALNVNGVDWIELTAMYPLDDNGHQMGTDLVQDIQAAPTRIPTLVASNLTVTGVGGLT